MEDHKCLDADLVVLAYYSFLVIVSEMPAAALQSMQSSLVRIDLLGRLLQRVEDIGTGVTNLAQWRDFMVVLGPDAVGLVNITNGAVDHEIYTVRPPDMLSTNSILQMPLEHAKSPL